MGKDSKSVWQIGTRKASSNLKNGHAMFSHITADFFIRFHFYEYISKSLANGVSGWLGARAADNTKQPFFWQSAGDQVKAELFAPGEPNGDNIDNCIFMFKINTEINKRMHDLACTRKDFEGPIVAVCESIKEGKFIF